MKKMIKKIVEQNPYLWQIVWDILHKTSIFLPHDPSYYALSLLVMDEQCLILDIGANKGVSALSFRKICPKANIISFEPNLALEQDLAKVKQRTDNFSYHMCGLGNSDADYKLYVPRYKNVWLHTFSSLDRKSLLKAINETYSHRIAKQVKVSEFDCEVRSLDSFNYSPDIIKIDAEGFELNILEGAKDTLKRASPSIIFEAVHGSLVDIVQILSDLDYKIFTFDQKKKILEKYKSTKVIQYVSGSRNLIAVHKSHKIAAT